LSSASPNTNATTQERRGQVLEILHELLSEGREQEVVELFTKLVARNTQLEKQLADIVSRRRKNEGVSTAQLRLFLDALRSEGCRELDEANDGLREASGVDDSAESDSEEKKKRRSSKPREQPRLREIPAHLRRVDNPIAVPEEERACPACGKKRACIGHDTTEVLELIPAEVIVRVDRREKLACKDCERAVTRAPQGDKVVSSCWSTSTRTGCRCIDRRSGLGDWGCP
jgi:hypothetical protein